jgi:quinoprotein glucose dehydrogenase
VSKKLPETGETLEPGKFEATPLMIGDRLYLSTPFNRVVALDATTGREIWVYDPDVARLGLIGDNRYGFVHRGVAAWSGDHERRLFLATRSWLIALDAETGRPLESFGENGRVDLLPALRWSANPRDLGNTSPPVVWRDSVIVGSTVADQLVHPRDPPGAVQAFDVRTGQSLWTWHSVPATNHPDRDSWHGDSAETTGHVNVWAPMSVDVERGLIYLPVSTPSNDWYGGGRLGDNLYADSLVCLDARTGTMRWHRQLVHHGLWDYDLAAAPLLATVHRESANVDAVFVTGKTGFLYAFDRITGEPLWPIPEKTVPSSDVPGEVASPTQPQPSWPLPFARQGFSNDDLIDFTPELRQEAAALIKGTRGGPLFTPPSKEGTITLPGWIGGAGWGGGTVDPERRLLFVKATDLPVLARLTPDAEARYRLDPTMDPSVALMLQLPEWREPLGRRHPAVRLPIVKPPYGTLTAYDIDSGETRWQIPIGDTPEIRAHPMLRDLGLPPLGVVGAPGGVATRGGLVFITGGGTTLYAVDQRDGTIKWSAPLGAVGYSNPMVYRTKNGVQFVVVAVGQGRGANLQAFSLSR